MKKKNSKKISKLSESNNSQYTNIIIKEFEKKSRVKKKNSGTIYSKNGSIHKRGYTGQTSL